MLDLSVSIHIDVKYPGTSLSHITRLGTEYHWRNLGQNIECDGPSSGELEATKRSAAGIGRGVCGDGNGKEYIPSQLAGGLLQGSVVSSPAGVPASVIVGGGEWASVFWPTPSVRLSYANLSRSMLDI